MSSTKNARRIGLVDVDGNNGFPTLPPFLVSIMKCSTIIPAWMRPKLCIMCGSSSGA